jgi:hypothetical protein
MYCPGGDGVPLTKKGYMMLAGSLFVYKCTIEDVCPGGPADTCKGTNIGTACSECEDGFVYKQGACEECGAFDSVMIYLVASSLAVPIGIMYYMMDSPLTAKATTLYCTSTAFGNLVSAMQVFAVYHMLTIPWPEATKAFLEFASLFALDLQILNVGCAYGTTAAARYLTSALFMPFVLFLIVIEYYIFNFLVKVNVLPKKRAWTWPKAFNQAGQLYSMTFTTSSVLALSSMTCYSHPVDKKSLVGYPEVICGTGEHITIILFGGFLTLCATAFLGMVVFATCKAPAKAAQGNVIFLQRFRFVFFRFRVDVWYWGATLLIRGLILASIPPLVPDSAHLQMILIVGALLVPLVLQVRKWPWKAPLLNVVDAIISGMLIFMIVSASGFTKRVEDADADAYKNLMTIEIIFMHCVLAVLMAMSVVALVRRGPMGSPSDVFNLSEVPDPTDLGTTWKRMSVATSAMDEDVIKEACAQFPVYDLWAMEQVMVILLGGTGSWLEGASLKRKKSLQMFSNLDQRNSFGANAFANPKGRSSLSDQPVVVRNSLSDKGRNSLSDQQVVVRNSISSDDGRSSLSSAPNVEEQKAAEPNVEEQRAAEPNVEEQEPCESEEQLSSI